MRHTGREGIDCGERRLGGGCGERVVQASHSEQREQQCAPENRDRVAQENHRAAFLFEQRIKSRQWPARLLEPTKEVKLA